MRIDTPGYLHFLLALAMLGAWYLFSWSGLEYSDLVYYWYRMDWLAFWVVAGPVLAILSLPLWGLYREYRAWKVLCQPFEIDSDPFIDLDLEAEALGDIVFRGGFTIRHAAIFVSKTGVIVRKASYPKLFPTFEITWDQISNIYFVKLYRQQKHGTDARGVARVTLNFARDFVLVLPWRKRFNRFVPETIGFERESMLPKVERVPQAFDTTPAHEELFRCFDAMGELLSAAGEEYWSRQVKKADVWIKRGDFDGVLRFLAALERNLDVTVKGDTREQLDELLGSSRRMVRLLEQRHAVSTLQRLRRWWTALDGVPFFKDHPGLVAAILSVVVFYLSINGLMALRPADNEGYVYWSGTVRYLVMAGDSGSVDLPPGRGVYEVQLQTGIIVAAYTMQEGGHELGSCVRVREMRRAFDPSPRFKIVSESNRC